MNRAHASFSSARGFRRELLLLTALPMLSEAPMEGRVEATEPLPPDAAAGLPELPGDPKAVATGAAYVALPL